MHIVPNSKGDTVKNKSVSHSISALRKQQYCLIIYKHVCGDKCFKNTQVVEYNEHYSTPFFQLVINTYL